MNDLPVHPNALALHVAHATAKAGPRQEPVSISAFQAAMAGLVGMAIGVFIVASFFFTL